MTARIPLAVLATIWLMYRKLRPARRRSAPAPKTRPTTEPAQITAPATVALPTRALRVKFDTHGLPGTVIAQLILDFPKPPTTITPEDPRLLRRYARPGTLPMEYVIPCPYCGWSESVGPTRLLAARNFICSRCSQPTQLQLFITKDYDQKAIHSERERVLATAMTPDFFKRPWTRPGKAAKIGPNLNIPIHILYRGGMEAGHERDFNIRSITGFELANGVKIDGFHGKCHMVNATRTFHIDQIEWLIDLRTGTNVADIRGWLAGIAGLSLSLD